MFELIPLFGMLFENKTHAGKGLTCLFLMEYCNIRPNINEMGPETCKIKAKGIFL